MLPESIILPPFAAALILGLGQLSGRIAGEASERFTRRLSLSAGLLSLLAVAAAVLLFLRGELAESMVLGAWLESGRYRIRIEFGFDALNLIMSSLIALLSLMVLRFSVNYMHREAGFHRFFMVLSLFVGAMQLLALGGNAVLTFAGWELAGVSSLLLIAYAYDRPTAAANATRAFVTNRIGDAGFVLGIFLAFAWIGAIDWPSITAATGQLSEWQAATLACAFLLAAVAKSAQVPLAPWLARAMEGPTPSSAIFYGALMVHAGVFLVLRLQPVFDQAPLAQALLVAVGLLTALYGWYCGLTQSDVKSALIFSTSAQVGLMFLEAGLGWWDLALWHLCAHAGFRAYQFLSAPSLMHQIAGSPARPPTASLAQRRGLYLASLHRLWLEHLGDALVVRPTQKLARDLERFDRQAIQRAAGLPLDALPEQAGKRPDDTVRVSGLAGGLVAALASLSFWFEDRLVLRGIGSGLQRAGRRLGSRLNHFEGLLNQPRYLVVFVLATLLAVF
ncbi:NADH-quinone oxidoreductase subunit L [Methylococcus sp. EFPC2]|uniref:NADH-quinone oxidoreductase subunit 5 family protein n=1 Tax=Methylococcus sp. EFPC2 TaxID=2812648 RepID=UPI001967F3AB|nr:proton-conducting transporter membrane subunit [Methylococcus sp. EFPC2]QSA98281.1 hypothetical protein JWZ97_05550 [Methylococcus sp. EFPC2]